MPRIVPVLEFIHELTNAGVRVDYTKAIREPEAYWTMLSGEPRANLLRRWNVELKPGEKTAFRIVKRRGTKPESPNLFVALGGDPGFWSRLRYEPYAAPPGSAGPEASETGGLFHDMSVVPGRGNVIELLDTVWGGAPYDEATEGALCEMSPPSRSEIERYWVQKPFAAVVIGADRDGQALYSVVEPELSDLENALLSTLNERLRDVLVSDEEPTDTRAAKLVGEVFGLLRMYRYRTTRRTAYKLAYYFVRNYLGLGRIEPVMRDLKVEDVSCNGPELPTYVAHSKYQNLRTNLVFDELELNTFTVKLAQRGGKLLSIAQPLVDATLPDGSRMQACLAREITSRGSAFTIRKFREDPLTAVDLVKSGTHSLEEMAFLWLAVELRRNFIIMGATASGKTTTLNCLSQFIPPAHKIVTIEDTREIMLHHENWLAAVTRQPFGGTEGLEISMYDLLKAALRQRPDYLIVGEIRGVEGATLFQAMSTGHTCFSTMHAGSVENAVYRLENSPINVPRVMLTALDFFLLQGAVDFDGKPVRRLLSVTEMNGIDPKSRNLRMNEVFKWDASTDIHAEANPSGVLDSARQRVGWTRSRLQEELHARQAVLEGLIHRNARHATEVAKAVRNFYAERAYERFPVPSVKAEEAKDLADVEFEIVEEEPRDAS